MAAIEVRGVVEGISERPEFATRTTQESLMPRMTGGVKTGRYYIRLPEDTITEIDGYIKESGMYPAYFLSNALIVGARMMARQLNPERFYTHEMVEAIAARANQQKGREQAQGEDTPPPLE
jgi:hypothetical protein